MKFEQLGEGGEMHVAPKRSFGTCHLSNWNRNQAMHACQTHIGNQIKAPLHWAGIVTQGPAPPLQWRSAQEGLALVCSITIVQALAPVAPEQ